MRNDIEDLIMKTLSEDWPMPAKDIYEELSDWDADLARQEVKKVYEKLEGDGVLLEGKSGYKINPEWIRERKKFIDKLVATHDLEIEKLNVEALKEAEMAQMKRKGILPITQEDVIYHLIEEVGEFAESIREEKEAEEVERELADILWQLNKLCWVRDVSLEEIFVRKLRINEDR